METSVYLAKVLGIVFAIMGLGILANINGYKKMFQDLLKNSACVYLAGLFALVVGILIVLSHNMWANSWAVVITVIGWISLIKGALLILFPSTMVPMKQRMCTPSWCTVGGIVALILGLYLMNMGFSWGVV